MVCCVDRFNGGNARNDKLGNSTTPTNYGPRGNNWIVAAAIIGAGVPFSLHYFPTPLSALIGVLALLLIVVAGLFGRVVVFAATGRWLQRKFLPIGRSSESVALLMGTSFWIILSSLPYIWPLVVAVMIVTSLGLALTARYRVGWGRSQPSLISFRP